MNKQSPPKWFRFLYPVVVPHPLPWQKLPPEGVRKVLEPIIEQFSVDPFTDENMPPEVISDGFGRNNVEEET